jgi:hypothetical protein
VIISISDTDSSGTHAPTGSGTYTYYGSSPPSPPYKSLNDFEVNAETDVNGRCGFQAIGTITSGTVTLDTVVADILTGTFDVMLDSGDHVTGSFHPSGCPELENPPDPTGCT